MRDKELPKKFTKGDPVIPYDDMKEFEKIADNDFEIKNGRLLIGGPFDGKRHVPRDIRKFEMLMMPIPSVATVSDWGKPDPVGPELRYTAYHPEVLRGKEIEVLFYRHQSLSVDQALLLLVAKYPNFV